MKYDKTDILAMPHMALCHITRQICVHTSDLSVKVTLSTETQPLITMTAPVTIQTRDSNL